MIFACLYWLGSVPSSRDARHIVSIRYLTAGQVCFQTTTGKPSSPDAFHDFAARSCRSTSSIVMASEAELWLSSRLECGSGMLAVYWRYAGRMLATSRQQAGRELGPDHTGGQQPPQTQLWRWVRGLNDMQADAAATPVTSHPLRVDMRSRGRVGGARELGAGSPVEKLVR